MTICRRSILALLAVLISAGGVARAVARDGGSTERRRPNIVFVLTDDLATNLIPYLPQVRRMQRQGMTFTNYFVTDSLCCPSRATTLTGRFPHNTGVFDNEGDDGGYGAFDSRGNQNDTFATALRGAGYRTALMGKYLNGYLPRSEVPPGWSEWAVAANGYRGFTYALNENGRVVRYGHRPQDYLTDVLARKGGEFIRRAARDGRPFLLELSTFTPHGPATPAPRDARAFPHLKAPRGEAFNEADVSDKPGWLRNRPELTPQLIARMDGYFRKRARSLLAVDKMIADIRTVLAAQGQDRNTYIIFTSDNGFHMGEHRLTPGKQTAFDTDIKVPLIVTGPDLTPGSSTGRLVQNTDLRPTFEQLAGRTTAPSVDGRSLVPYLRGSRRSARSAVLIEHHGPNTSRHDPDRQRPRAGNPPTYWAIRTDRELYVEYSGGEQEYYDLTRDPQQLRNAVRELSPGRLAALKAELDRLRACKGRNCR